jgi:transcriptional regulator with XRE-family HTH domain
MKKIPYINSEKTGHHIDELMLRKGLSVRDLQMQFGFTTPQAIYKWLHGTSLPSIDNLVILSVILGVSMDDIIVLDAHPTK